MRYVSGNRFLMDDRLAVVYVRSAGGDDIIVKVIETAAVLVVNAKRLTPLDKPIESVASVPSSTAPNSTVDKALFSVGNSVNVTDPDFGEHFNGTVAAIGDDSSDSARAGLFLVADSDGDSNWIKPEFLTRMVGA